MGGLGNESQGGRLLMVPRRLTARASIENNIDKCGPGCSYVMGPPTETVDRLLIQSSSFGIAQRWSPSHPRIIDILKIHAEEKDIKILRGARASLREGLICVCIVVTNVNPDTIAMGLLQSELKLLLPNFRIFLPRNSALHFIAWHRGDVCSPRRAVQAARSLWEASGR